MSIELSESIIKKLDFIDDCRKRFSVQDNERLKLPQIIAVGDQSSGKSSILEAISGIKLPKGQQTVTKRPIVVHMRKSEVEKCSIKCRSKTFEVNLANVEEKIREVQGDSVTAEPIYVDVFSPNVPPLTIIDLPGIVKQALRGQNEDIIKNTQEVSKLYMKQENSLILCVIPANADFNTVDTLLLASECDKDKSRTMGVLTKVDKLADEEINVKVDILNNISKPLNKGYYGLILSDSILSLDHKDRETKEIEEFHKKGELWKRCQKHLGLKTFTKKLVEELLRLIDLRLPALKTEMEELLKVTDKELELHQGIFCNPSSQRRHLIEIKDSILWELEKALVKGNAKLYDYKKCETFLKENSILTNSVDKHDTFLFGQHEIFKTLSNKFNKFFKDNFKLQKSPYSIKHLQTLSERCTTEHISLFLSSEPFKEIVRVHLEEYEKQSLKCLEVCEGLTGVFIDVMVDQKSGCKIPELKIMFKEICNSELTKQINVTTERIKMIFKSENRCFTLRNLVENQDEKEITGEGDSAKPLAAPNIQTMAASKISSSTSMGTLANFKPKEGDNISLNGKDDSKYSGKKLKEALEKYIQNLVLRLADVVPNLIMLTLFEEFHFHLNANLNDYISNNEVLEYFKSSESEERTIEELSKTQLALKESLRKLKKLLKNE